MESSPSESELALMESSERGLRRPFCVGTPVAARQRSAILSLVVLQEADEMTRATRITERMLVHPPGKASASANRRGAAAMVKKRRPRPSPQRTGERLEPIAKNKDP